MVIECKYRAFDNEGYAKWIYDILHKEIRKLPIV